MLGIWAEETDSLYDDDRNSVAMHADGGLAGGGLMGAGHYAVKDLCDLVHCETARSLGSYESDFYAGMPALTVNSFGRGKAWYIAFRNNDDFERDFYGNLAGVLHLRNTLKADLPRGVTAQMRTDGENEFIFVMNFSCENRTVSLKDEGPCEDMLTGERAGGEMSLAPYGVRVLRKKVR